MTKLSGSERRRCAVPRASGEAVLLLMMSFDLFIFLVGDAEVPKLSGGEWRRCAVPHVSGKPNVLLLTKL